MSSIQSIVSFLLKKKENIVAKHVLWLVLIFVHHKYAHIANLLFSLLLIECSTIPVSYTHLYMPANFTYVKTFL